jgi:DNA-binding GntR family transcriptional regulator
LFWVLAERIHERSILIRALVEAKGTSQDITQIIDEHCLITQALRAHDTEQVRKAMVAHLEAGCERTLRVLDQLS